MPAQVFGPVTKPLYALRYGGPAQLEGTVAVGAPVMAVQKRAVFVNAAEAQRPVRSAVTHVPAISLQHVAECLAMYGRIRPPGVAVDVLGLSGTSASAGSWPFRYVSGELAVCLFPARGMQYPALSSVVGARVLARCCACSCCGFDCGAVGLERVHSPVPQGHN